MKFAATLLLGFLAGACSHASAPTAAPSKASLAADLERKTVALLDENSVAYCSGVWLDEQFILTAAHCTEIGPAILYATHSDVFPALSLHKRKVVSGHTAGVLAVDEEHDLAILLAPNAPPHATAKTSLAEVHAGDDAYTMGHPRGLWWSFSAGNVAAIREFGIQSTAPISPGCSGGGLFDGEGGLIGIARRQLPPRVAQNVNIYVAPHDIVAFLVKSGLQ